LRTALRTIGEEKLFDDLELPLVDVLVSMEQTGMLLDVKRLQELGIKLEADAERLQSEVWEAAGEEFNIGSTKQLQVVLFEKLGLSKGRATKTGFSTDVHTLERLAEDHEIVRKILDYRGTTKLKTTYVEALLKGMDSSTHRYPHQPQPDRRGVGTLKFKRPKPAEHPDSHRAGPPYSQGFHRAAGSRHFRPQTIHRSSCAS
jgi:DNA polymerase-1